MSLKILQKPRLPIYSSLNLCVLGMTFFQRIFFILPGCPFCSIPQQLTPQTIHTASAQLHMKTIFEKQYLARPHVANKLGTHHRRMAIDTLPVAFYPESVSRCTKVLLLPPCGGNHAYRINAFIFSCVFGDLLFLSCFWRLLTISVDRQMCGEANEIVKIATTWFLCLLLAGPCKVYLYMLDPF